MNKSLLLTANIPSFATKISEVEPKERIILGIDPGTQVLGYGLIMAKGKQLSLLQYGVLQLHKYEDSAVRLQHIFKRVLQLIDEYHPDEMALEAPFFGKNIQSMLKLGRAQGVAMAAALSRDIPIVEYSPKKIKMAITGNGNASKEQVAVMLGQTLQFKPEDGALLDATDALGVAVCHCYQNGVSSGSGGKANGWGAFIKKNPDRLK